MGCWNHTCAITNLPIFEGEEVEVILLGSNTNPYNGSYCEANEYHTPMPLTFSGEYDDYGGFINCKGSALNIVIAGLRTHLLEMPEGDNIYHEIEVSKEKFDVTELFRLDREGRLYIHTHQFDTRDKIRVQHIAIKKAVYDDIAHNMYLESWDSDTNDVTTESLCDERKQFQDDLNAYINGTDEQRDAANLKALLGRPINESRLGQIIKDLKTHPFEISNVLTDMTKRGDDINSILTNIIHFHMFKMFMTMSRKSWHIPSGVGSQDDSTGYQTWLAGLTIDAARDITKQWEE